MNFRPFLPAVIALSAVLAEPLAVRAQAPPPPLMPSGLMPPVPAAPIWIQRARVPGEGVRDWLFGAFLFSPGDINGDGFDDILVGDQPDGRLCVSYGRLGYSTTSPDFCLVHAADGSAIFL